MLKKKFCKVCSCNVILNKYKQCILHNAAYYNQNAVIFLIVLYQQKQFHDSIQTNFFEQQISHILQYRKKFQLTVKLMIMNNFTLTNQTHCNINMNIIHNFISNKIMLNQFQDFISISIIFTKAVVIKLQKLISNCFLMRYIHTICLFQNFISVQNK